MKGELLIKNVDVTYENINYVGTQTTIKFSDLEYCSAQK
jgi:hypothetical protein